MHTLFYLHRRVSVSARAFLSVQQDHIFCSRSYMPTPINTPILTSTNHFKMKHSPIMSPIIQSVH